jgi:hypothetical protein
VCGCAAAQYPHFRYALIHACLSIFSAGTGGPYQPRVRANAYAFNAPDSPNVHTARWALLRPEQCPGARANALTFHGPTWHSCCPSSGTILSRLPSPRQRKRSTGTTCQHKTSRVRGARDSACWLDRSAHLRSLGAVSTIPNLEYAGHPRSHGVPRAALTSLRISGSRTRELARGDG